MENNSKLCLYVSYYLSRFNVVGYNNLGYTHMNYAHSDIGKILNINPNTVKNMRDGFDPLHGFRAGWYQAPLSPSRVRVVEAMKDFDEFEIRSIVLQILNQTVLESEDVVNLLAIVSDENIINDNNKKSKFILRGPTGKKAEDFFLKHYEEFGLPVRGTLVDTRDFGTGYDFRIKTTSHELYIEVKGIGEGDGGVLFTAKEWSIARVHREKYYLVIISDVNNEPVFNLIQDPFSKLTTKQNIVKSFQINWSVTRSELSKQLL